MEIKAKIMVKIATVDGATTIIGTMTIAIVTETTTGGGEFRGLTNRNRICKRRGKGWENFPDRASLFSSLQPRLILTRQSSVSFIKLFGSRRGRVRRTHPS